MKYIFDQNLIKQLQDGKIAINYGDSKMADKLDKLNSLLKEAFPTCLSTEGNYYFYSKGNFLWISSNETNLPSPLLDNFIFEPGDTLYHSGYSDKYFFIGFDNTGIPVVCDIRDGNILKLQIKEMGKLTKLPPKTRLTKQQIADKFGISVDNLEIV